MKIPSSFSTTIFSSHRIQYESGAFGESDFSDNFFFLPSTVDRIEKINRYLGSVNLNVIDIGLSEFGEKFDPSILDSIGTERESVRKSVLGVLKKVADYSCQNLKRDAGGYFATVPHDSNTLLWPGGKRTQSDKFCLSY